MILPMSMSWFMLSALIPVLQVYGQGESPQPRRPGHTN
jgi:hypothetical protein